MVGCRIYIQNTDWLGTLLRSKFFGSCEIHSNLRKNEENVFCIDCNLGFCKHCVTAHCLHRRLQICKYVYHDVVRLQDMQKHLDCSKIQTYKINGEKAVHLNPRPQSKDSKPSTKSKNGASCKACRRYLQDPPNCYCSIACKASLGALEKPENHDTNTFAIHEFNHHLPLKEEEDSPEREWYGSESSDDTQAWGNSTFLKPRKQLHKRKGVPHRSPLC